MSLEPKTTGNFITGERDGMDNGRFLWLVWTGWIVVLLLVVGLFAASLPYAVSDMKYFEWQVQVARPSFSVHGASRQNAQAPACSPVHAIARFAFLSLVAVRSQSEKVEVSCRARCWHVESPMFKSSGGASHAQLTCSLSSAIGVHCADEHNA